MISANEALRITMAANRIKNLEDQVRAAAKQGLFELVPRMNLDTDDIKLLKELGYKVKTREVTQSTIHGGVGDDEPNKIIETYIAWNQGF